MVVLRVRIPFKTGIKRIHFPETEGAVFRDSACPRWFAKGCNTVLLVHNKERTKTEGASETFSRNQALPRWGFQDSAFSASR